MGVVVTQQHTDMARAAGACGEINRITPGMSLDRIPSAHLAWCEEHCPDESRELATVAAKEAGISGAPPLSVFGYGDGDGYGDGAIHTAS